MEFLGALGTLIHEKNLKSKISCQTPFNSNSFSIRTLSNVSGDSGGWPDSQRALDFTWHLQSTLSQPGIHYYSMVSIQ
jgi:hypothetical protein